jgi:hypothetical protein
MVDNKRKMRRLLVAGLVATPIAASAQQQPPAAAAPARAPAAKKLMTDGLQRYLEACSTSDTKCCYLSEVQGDICCPNLMVGPKRANLTAADLKTLEAKFGKVGGR